MKWLTLGSEVLASAVFALIGCVGFEVPASANPVASANCLVAASGVNEGLVLPQGGTLPFNGFNQFRNANQVIVYTPSFGTTTGTNQYGAEITVVNGVVTAVNNGFVTGQGNSPIPPNGYVISAQGGPTSTAVADILQFKVGQPVQISLPLPPTTATITLSAPPNPTAQNNPAGAPYPALRGPNQLIVYTPAWGARTGTNPWGSEATIVNGMVTHIGGGDSAIPKNGYVLSGDGTSQTWILSHLIVGARVTMLKTTEGIYQISAVTTPKAFLRQAEASLNGANTAVSSARADLYQLPNTAIMQALSRLQGDVNQAQRALAAGDFCTLMGASGKAYQLDRTVHTLLIPSSPAENRAVWYSATSETVTFTPTPAGVNAAVSKLVAGHMNTLVLMLPRSAQHDPRYQGHDMAKAFIQDAQQQHLNVFLNFFSLLASNAVFQAHPNWEMVNYQGQQSHPYGVYGWLDPAIPSVRHFIVQAIAARVQALHPNGIVLDSMHYPRTEANYQTSFSYNAYDIAAFEHLTGVNPQTITPTTNPTVWQEWTTWREAQLSRLVQDIHHMLEQVAPHTRLFAAVGPSLANDQTNRLENLALWAQKHWINGYFPEIYQFPGKTEAAVNTRPFVSMAKESLVSAILNPADAQTPNALAGQISGVKSDQVAGEQFFSNVSMTRPIYQALLAGPYRNPAVDPLTNPLAAVAANNGRVQANLTALYEPAGLSQAAAHVIRARLSAISNLVTDGHPQVVPALRQISALAQWIQDAPGDQIPAVVATRILGHLQTDQQWLHYGLTLPEASGGTK